MVPISVPALLLICLLAACSNGNRDGHAADRYDLVTVASGLEHPWSMAFLPDGRMLVSERPGRLRIVSKGHELSAPLTGLPAVFARGQGGLLDVRPDPDFTDNQLIYFSYAEPAGGKARTAVARARLAGGALEDLQVIFRQQPATEGSSHFGSRLVFAPDGTLFVTLGERFDFMEQAQHIENTLGALVRINPDGSIPPDNPFVGRQGALPEIWSFGHRNIQGAAVHPESGAVWIHEHGPRGGDEINIPVAGKNYGWPEASYGMHYWMVPIRDEHAARGFEEPVYHWTPSIAPSGMLFYTGDRFPQWQGRLFVGALAGTRLVMLQLDGDRVTGETALLEHLQLRIRDVAQDSDGYIYVLTDEENGKILKLAPKQ